MLKKRNVVSSALLFGLISGFAFADEVKAPAAAESAKTEKSEKKSDCGCGKGKNAHKDHKGHEECKNSKECEGHAKSGKGACGCSHS